MTEFSEDHIRLAEALIFANPGSRLRAPARLPAARGCGSRGRAARHAGTLRRPRRRARRNRRRLAIPHRRRSGAAPDARHQPPAPAAARGHGNARHHPPGTSPVTRAQIEEIRGATSGQQTVDALLEAGLVRTAGHREVPGRPTLWATTPQFLAQFGLKDLRDLPKREELVTEQPSVLDPPPAAPAEEAARKRRGIHPWTQRPT